MFRLKSFFSISAISLKTASPNTLNPVAAERPGVVEHPVAVIRLVIPPNETCHFTPSRRIWPDDDAPSPRPPPCPHADQDAFEQYANAGFEPAVNSVTKERSIRVGHQDLTTQYGRLLKVRLGQHSAVLRSCIIRLKSCRIKIDKSLPYRQIKSSCC